MRRAVFLDRDGTLVQPRHYPSSPDELVLFPNISPLLRRLHRAGFVLVVITNQSGLARGLFTEDDLVRMHRHLQDELAEAGVPILAFYYCPHHVEGTVSEWTRECDCRKPKPGMLLRAAYDLDLDLSSSWFIGDILDDVEAGNRAGCRTVLVDLGSEPAPDSEIKRPNFVSRDTAHALRIVLAVERKTAEPELTYQPSRWQAGQALTGAAP